jgi:branched-chain amino acid transport system substrate-binding protein
MKLADSVDPVAIRDALVNTEFDGVTGHIFFDENGDAVKNMAVIKVIENGEFKFLQNVTIE